MKQVPFGPVRFDILQLKRKDRSTINSIEELQEELDMTLTEVSGNPITISDASNTNAEDFIVTLVPTQAGTGDPSPYNIRAITGLSSVNVVLNDNTISFSLGSTVYGGTINFSTGVLTVNKVGIVLDGSEDENWTCVETSGHYRGYVTLTDIKALNSDTAITEVICDKIPSGKWPETYTGNFKLGQVGKNVGFGLDSLEIDTTADLRTWLTSNNLQFVYPLATPTTTQLTAQQIRLLQGENELSTTGSSMSFKYQRDNLIGELKAWVLDQLS